MTIPIHIEPSDQHAEGADDPGRPLVSVCIPAYQAARYLQATIDSILAQTHRDFELVIVDNASTDGTREILDAITDDRVRVVRNESTIPVVDNFNCAVRHTRGELVKLVCADDLLAPDCLGEQVAVLVNSPDVALVSARTDFVDDDGEVIVKARGLRGMGGRLPADTAVRRLVHNGGNPIGAPVAVMFRRVDFDRCGGFHNDQPFLADLDLWVRLLRGGDFVGLTSTLGSFRVHSESVSGLTSVRSQISAHRAFDRVLRADTRWNLTIADRVRGRIGCYENVLRRLVLFAVAALGVAHGAKRGQKTLPPPEITSEPAETLSVVICAYTLRRWDEICAAVESVLAQDFAVREVLLVIDHNPELYDRAFLQFAAADRVTVCENIHESGLSGARNSGVDAATGDIVAFLDDDAAAEPGWAAGLMAHYQDGAVAGVGGYAEPVWPQARPAWMPGEFDWVVGCSYIGQPMEPAAVRNPLGCNMSLRRSVFGEVGGFSAEVGRVGSHPVGGEETELCIRIGVRWPHSHILFDPDVRVRHHVSDDRTRLSYFMRRCYHEGMSKGIVSELADTREALGTERSYAVSTLPRGVLRECASLSGDGFARASVIVLGLALTTAGYVNARGRIMLAGVGGAEQLRSR